MAHPFFMEKNMASNFVFKVNGTDCPTPSAFGWSLQDISAADSGRTEDGIMHKNKIAQKEKIQLSWNAPDSAKTAQILQLFQPEYFELTYRSPLANAIVTKTFYRGDASAATYWWRNNGLFETISFDVIEV